MTQSFFTKGINSTLQFSRGINLSYQSKGVAIYESTDIDTWYVGDFISAEYIIHAEFGINERETIHATLVATPGQSSITIYGRTSLTRPLINIRSIATDSHVKLVVQPASLDTQGSIVSFFANYAKASLPIKPLNTPAIATNCSWAYGENLTSLVINIPSSYITGSILTGQRVICDNIPLTATVSSYDKTNQTLVIGGFSETTFQQTQHAVLKFETTVIGNSVNTIKPNKTFKSFLVPGSQPITATTTSDQVSLIPGSGIDITTNVSNKEIVISSTNENFKAIAVSGKPMMTATSEENVLTLIASNGIAIDTNNSNKSVTISVDNVVKSLEVTTDLVVNETATINTLSVSDKIAGNLTIDGYITASGESVVDSLVVNGNLTVNGTTTTINASTVDIEDINITLGKGALTSSSVNGGGIMLDGASATFIWDSTSSSWTSNKSINPSNTQLSLGNNANYWNSSYITSINGTIVTASQPNITSVGALTDLSVVGTATINNIVTTNLNITGITSIGLTSESIVDATGASSVTYEVDRGAIFYHSISPTMDWNAAFVDVPTTNYKVTTITIIVPQSASAFKITTCSINGDTQTIKWLGVTTPSGNALKTDIWAFSLIRRNNTWIVLASLTGNFG